MNSLLETDSAHAYDVQSSRSINACRTRFLDYCRVGKSLSINTLRAYESDLLDLARFVGGERSVSEIGKELVRAYVRKLFDVRHCKQTTVKRRVATLKVFFRWLEREQLVTLSVLRQLDFSIRLPRRLPRALEKAEMRLLLRASTTALTSNADHSPYEAALMHFVVVALFTTGLRVGELTSVQLSDVSIFDGSIQVRGKGGRERRVYLPGPEALSVLKGFLRSRCQIRTSVGHLLVTPAGLPVSAQYVRTRLRKLGAAAGVSRRVTPHMLRHTAATQLLEAGVDIRFVQKLLGHSSIATTQLYTHVRNSTLKARLVRANTLARLEAG